MKTTFTPKLSTELIEQIDDSMTEIDSRLETLNAAEKELQTLNEKAESYESQIRLQEELLSHEDRTGIVHLDHTRQQLGVLKNAISKQTSVCEQKLAELSAIPGARAAIDLAVQEIHPQLVAFITDHFKPFYKDEPTACQAAKTTDFANRLARLRSVNFQFMGDKKYAAEKAIEILRELRSGNLQSLFQPQEK